jgi:hypothetical protein
MRALSSGRAVLADIVFFPLLTLVAVGVSAVAVAIVLGKRSSGGLVGTSTGGASLVRFVSSAASSSLPVPLSWMNRVVYVSVDTAIGGSGATVELFAPNTVPDGTTLTIFNAPSSPVMGTVRVLYNVESPVVVNLALGRGQGVTLITQRGIPRLSITNLTPPEAQQREWRVFKMWQPQCGAFCVSDNGVADAHHGVCSDAATCPALGSISGTGSAATTADENAPDLSCKALNCNCVAGRLGLYCV